MSSTAVTHVTRLRDPHAQRTHTCRRVFGAAAAMLDESAQDDVSVHALAVARTLIAAEVRRRIAAAMGMGAWPEVLQTLETLFWGALLQVESGAVSYRAMANRLDTMLALILPEAGH